MIGKKITPILEEIENAIIDFDFHVNSKPEYTQNAMRAATKIFMSVLMDKMYELQNFDNMLLEDRKNMAERAGNDLRKLIKSYTGLDTWDFYKKE